MSLCDPPGEPVISAMEKMQNFFILDEGVNAQQFLEKRIEDKSSSGNQEPFFVADLNDVAQKHWGFLKKLPRVKPFYAVKCNSSMGVLQTLASLGTGFSCASKEEIDMVLSIGISADDIVYSNPYKQLSHIRHAAKLGIRKMTFDCESELEKITGSHLKTEMILRIKSNNTTQLSRKVGTPLEDCRHLLEYAKDHRIQVIGVSFYVGYRCSPHDFTQSIEDASLVYKMGIQIGHAMKLLDIGGGFPGASESIHMFPEFADAVNSALIKHFPESSEVEVIAEPGKYYVESAFSSAVNVICKKDVDPEGPMGSTCKKIIYYVNDGTFGSHKNNMLRRIPVRPFPIKYVDPTQPRYPSLLWGPSCAPNDKILNEENLPELNVGEWIMFQDMGAYSISMSTEFNGFPHLPVYYVLSRELQQMLVKPMAKHDSKTYL